MISAINNFDKVRKLVAKRVCSKSDLFDDMAIDYVHQNDGLILRFVAKNEDIVIEQLVESVVEYIFWRETNLLDQVRGNSFPDIFYQSGLVTVNRTSGGNLIGYVRASYYKKLDELTASLLSFCVHLLDRVEQLKNSSKCERVDLVIDLKSATLSQLDVQLTTTLISILINYYPNLFNAILIIEMPFLLKAATLLALKAVPGKYRKLVKLRDRKWLIRKFGRDSIADFCGGSAKANLELLANSTKQRVSLERFAEKNAISLQTVCSALHFFNSLKN